MTTTPTEALPRMAPDAIVARAIALDMEEEGIVGLIPRPELAAIVATYVAGLGLLALGIRLTWAAGRDVAGGITARLTGS